jgi:predicted small secreted protein
MRRSSGAILAILLAAAVLGASADTGRGAGPQARRGATFTPAGVRACLRRARTSAGNVMVESDSFLARRLRARAVIDFWLLRGDVGTPGVKIAFAASPDDTARLRRAAFAEIARRQGPRFARSLVFRERANVVSYHQKSAGREVVRIANGCLGGPPYRGDGGVPPPGFPVP